MQGEQVGEDETCQDFQREAFKLGVERETTACFSYSKYSD